MAYVRNVPLENAARRLEEGANGRAAFESLAAWRPRATSIVKGFADAIVWLLVAKSLERGGLEVLNRSVDVDDRLMRLR